MSLMGHYHFTLRNFQRLVYLSSLLSILSFILLLWAYRPVGPISLYSQAQIPVTTRIPTTQNQILLRTRPPSRVLELRSARQFQDLTTVPTRLPPGCGPGQLDREKAPFVAVNGTKTLLVSAYQEHRTHRREVRVIAVVMRSETAAYRCLLCCQGQRHISAGDFSVHWDHFGFNYGTADIMCPLPSGCETPSHIAVGVANGAEKTEEEPVVFLEVLNQQPGSDSFPHNFTVCFSTMFDFTNVLQLAQSLEMLRLLGVSKVVIYKTSCSPDTQRLLDYYTHTGLVEVIPWRLSSLLNVSRGWQPEQSPGQVHYYGQLPALNDCVYRTMYQTHYLALHDMDELILPQTVNSWGELMPLLEKQHGSDFGYMFENNVFPIYSSTAATPTPSPTLHTTTNNNAVRWRGVTGVNILEHLYREPNDPKMFANFKIIVNPRAVFSTTVHGLLNSLKGCVRVDFNMARMYHTRSPWHSGVTPDQLVFDGRLLDFALRLTPAVDAVLRETGLIT